MGLYFGLHCLIFRQFGYPYRHFFACVMVLGSILYIRKTINDEMPYVPPDQGFTIVFFINLLLFLFVYIAFLASSEVFWQHVLFSPWFDWDPPKSGQNKWRDVCFYWDIPNTFGQRYKWTLMNMCGQLSYQTNVWYLA